MIQWRANNLAILVFFVVTLTSCSTVRVEETPRSAPAEVVSKVGPARSQTKKPIGKTLKHTAFTVLYDPERRMAVYVRYSLTDDQLRQSFMKRKSNPFKADPKLKEQGLAAVKPSEYLRTGYDRGHLAPAVDFAWNEAAYRESFYMSNMAPQEPGLNQKAWKALEEQVRLWACGEKKVTIFTGPLTGDQDVKLPSGLPVPGRFFKVVVDDTPPRKAIAFIYGQKDHEPNVMAKRRVTLTEVSNASGVDFAAEAGLETGLRAPSAFEDWQEGDCLRGR